jgi:hypothetical protein
VFLLAIASQPGELYGNWLKDLDGSGVANAATPKTGRPNSIPSYSVKLSLIIIEVLLLTDVTSYKEPAVEASLAPT